MENISQEQFLALGVIGFAVIGVALLVTFAMMAGTLKLSISWFGKASPSYIACLGWLLAITFVNCFIVFGTLSVAGERAVLLVTPLTWFVTLYMVSTAANCGLIRAFGIWFVNSILSTFGLAAIFFVVSIPLAIIGAGVNAGGDNLQAEFDKMDAMMADRDAQMETPDQMDFPETTEVYFQTPEPEQPSQLEDQPDGPSTSELNAPETQSPELSSNKQNSYREAQTRDETKPRKSGVSESRQKSPRRAADGSLINPFFQD